MHKRKWIILSIFLVEVLLALCSNLLLLRTFDSADDLTYRVEIGRVRNALRSGVIPEITGFTTIKEISVYDPRSVINEDYTVATGKDGTLYRIVYSGKKEVKPFLMVVNTAWALVFLLTLGILIYVKQKILNPFQHISELPLELAKGNLSIPVKEEKDRYFGRFLWGMDMLREKLEEEKTKRLAMEQEKKTLILTMSHDIKTPLSAINLYNKALASGLYETDEKKEEAYRGIQRNAELLEQYIEEIQKTAREDFLDFQVKQEEWYLSEVITQLEALYKEKAAERRIDFSVDPHDDCLIRGDRERSQEVLQNLMENALKYGDGRWIRIRFAEEEDCRLVTVENTGCTLSERELPNIFDSFYRGSNARKEKGSGLGLFISRKLMQAMEGDIYAEVTEDRFRITAVFRKG